MEHGITRSSRFITVAALLAVAAICWGLLVRSASVMSTMQGGGLLLTLVTAMMQPADSGAYLVASALMWIVMMSAMMIPAVLPVALLFVRLDFGRSGRSARLDGVFFTGGYLFAWLFFALAATLLQWGLHRATLLHSDVLSISPVLASGILLVAGVYQLTPFKSACLAHCQTPIGFFLSQWREGASGAYRMGLHHGAYCLGCCWALMLLMFVSGVMSVGAMAVLSVFILTERLLPPRPWAAQLPGLALIVWGMWTLVQPSR